jgi:hypothetical protein
VQSPQFRPIKNKTKELKLEQAYDPAIPLLGTFQRNLSQNTIKTLAHPCLLQHYSQ